MSTEKGSPMLRGMRTNPSNARLCASALVCEVTGLLFLSIGITVIMVALGLILTIAIQSNEQQIQSKLIYFLGGFLADGFYASLVIAMLIRYGQFFFKQSTFLIGGCKNEGK